MKKSINVVLFLFLFSALLNIAYGQTSIEIGETGGRHGETVHVPVELSSDTDYVALLLRLEYDADRLIPEEVHHGALMTLFHSIDFFSPEEGRINIIVYGYNQYAAFIEQNGIIAAIEFLIKPLAPQGVAEIFITAAGAPDLPSSQLVDSLGNILNPEVISGKVMVEPKTMAATWTLF